jgi:hypothetical protein
LSFKFDYRVLSERLRIKDICGSDIQRTRVTPCPKDVDLRNGSRREEEGERAPTKQQQDKI